MNRRLNFFLFLAVFVSVLPLSAAEVFPGHPRLLFRDQPWAKRCVTTDVLKVRARDPRYAPFLKRLGDRGPQSWAMRAVILDDGAAADSAITELLRRRGYGDTTDAGLELMWDAFAFDWLYNHPNFSEEEKKQVIENLVRGAQSCIQ
ncbi:MAG: hypothetical protein V1794_02635, partial [Candidatus Glassbacteria bacterium]